MVTGSAGGCHPASEDGIDRGHDRAHVFQTKLIEVPQAVVALHHRTVLLISRAALELLSGAELQALVAHEVGHDYFWPEFERTLAHEATDRGGRNWD